MAGEGTPVDSDVEAAGTARIQRGAWLSLVGLILSVVGYLRVQTAGIFFVNVTSASLTQTILTTELYGYIIEVTGTLFLLLSFALYISGFTRFRQADRRYRLPTRLALVGVGGLIVYVAITAVNVYATLRALQCPGKFGSCQLDAITLPTGAWLLGTLGGVVALIGLLGVAFGLFRFGMRYSNSLATVGSILYAIPLLDVFGSVLVILGTREVGARFRQSRQSIQPAPAIPQPPPPMI